MNANDLFLSAMDWLKLTYNDQRFYKERDLVWLLQTRLTRLTAGSTDVTVYNDHRIEIDGHRRYCDLVLVSASDPSRIPVAVELKYEPAHERTDIFAGKFPACFWDRDGIGDDVAKVRSLGAHGVESAHAILVDEGRYWRSLREPHEGAKWVDWDCGGVGFTPSLHWFTSGALPS
jgi:hypothetical protein